MAGMRRSEVAALRWADLAEAPGGDGILVAVGRGKTNQAGEAAEGRVGLASELTSRGASTTDVHHRARRAVGTGWPGRPGSARRRARRRAAAPVEERDPDPNPAALMAQMAVVLNGPGGGAASPPASDTPPAKPRRRRPRAGRVPVS